jgi:hypothetical protein
MIANIEFALRTRYRELVGTAETIVLMNREIQEVDSTLSDIGRRCNPRLIERMHAHMNQIKDDVQDKGKKLALWRFAIQGIDRIQKQRDEQWGLSFHFSTAARRRLHIF